MKIQYIQDMEIIDNDQHEGWLKGLKSQKYNSFNFEMNRWEEEMLLIRTDRQDDQQRPVYISHFVGIIWYENTLILSLPKAVDAAMAGESAHPSEVLFRYAALMDVYFDKVREAVNQRNYEPAYPWCIANLKDWCAKMVSSDAVLPMPQVIAAVKFEKVFEWMLGKLFDNRIVLDGQRVLFHSTILGEPTAFVTDATVKDAYININDPKYNTYAWDAIGKRNSKDNRVETREDVFGDQQMKNIPDIVTEIILEEPEKKKCCCVIDAKYSGWNKAKNCYKLPRNMDIYKQFFYQEQFLRIYEEFGAQDVNVYNFLVLPDYMDDIKDGVLRQCAVIPFAYHLEQSIAVLQVNMEALIDICVNHDQALIDKKNRGIQYMLTTYKKIVPMKSRAEKEQSLQ